MNPRNNKRLNWLLLAGSILAALVFCEVLARFTYSTSDIFPSHPQTDPVLGHRLLPFQSGHDSRGFRNENADGDFPVVCIGDSQIYGNGIPRKSAIPQQLGRIIKKRVYNMAMGGYGPVQYYQLLDQAQELHPQKIIIGFYLGNDLLDAYYLANQHDHWKWLLQQAGPDNQLNSISLCQVPYKSVHNDELFSFPEVITLKLRKSNSILWKVHSYFLLHSALYSLQYACGVKPLIQRFMERGMDQHQPGAFICPEVDTIFTPGIMVSRMDLRDNKVRQGTLITQRIIELMARQYPREELLFVFIPTKEAVYYKYLKNEKVSIPPEYTCSVYYEKEITKRLSRAITAAGFRVVEVLPALEEAALQGQLVHPASSDAHLNSAGARIVASCLGKALEQN